MAHRRGHHRTVNGKRVWVADHDVATPPGATATADPALAAHVGDGGTSGDPFADRPRYPSDAAYAALNRANLTYGSGLGNVEWSDDGCLGHECGGNGDPTNPVAVDDGDTTHLGAVCDDCAPMTASYGRSYGTDYVAINPDGSIDGRCSWQVDRGHDEDGGRIVESCGAPLTREDDHAVLDAEWRESFDALRAAGLEADADHPIAARYRAASDAVNHANRKRDFATVGEDDSGFACVRGHSHVNQADYYDDDEIRGSAFATNANPNGAFAMDGTAVDDIAEPRSFSSANASAAPRAATGPRAAAEPRYAWQADGFTRLTGEYRPGDEVEFEDGTRGKVQETEGVNKYGAFAVVGPDGLRVHEWHPSRILRAGTTSHPDYERLVIALRHESGAPTGLKPEAIGDAEELLDRVSEDTASDRDALLSRALTDSETWRPF